MTPPTEGDDYKPTPDGFPAVKFDSPTEGDDTSGEEEWSVDECRAFRRRHRRLIEKHEELLGMWLFVIACGVFTGLWTLAISLLAR